MAYTYDGGPRKPPLLQPGIWAFSGAVLGTVGGGFLGYHLLKAKVGSQNCDESLRMCVSPVTAATFVGIPVGVALGFLVGYVIGGFIQGRLQRK